ncbi:MAG: pro-sigmaK processing inhibitor BofA family protein [Clostridiales bacterium]|jgi:predicted membrane channel-forming protein YqfA (hemolysin III family)|nr:pro-sigmaK processing inhibitor BofA family protein [Clostridiales bacterium]
MPGGFSSSYMILMMAAVCLIAIVAMVFQRQLKHVLRFLIHALFGCTGIFLLNFLLSRLGIASGVGINPLSAGVVGLLGLPGFVTLYFTGVLL